VLKNALKMAFGTMVSRILGQLRESLLAAYFDKRVTDAWAAAFRLPNMFRRLLGEGSLSVSFIPVFVDARMESQEKAQNLVNSVYTFLLMILGCLTAFGILCPEILLNRVLDPVYIADTEKYLLTLRLTKIMFGFIFFISSYAFMMGILNALGHFALPAAAPTLWNICMIISTVIPHRWFEHTGDQLAWGVLIGGAIQALILVPSLIKSGYFPKLCFNYKNPYFLRVVKNMGPGMIGMGLLQFTTIVNLRFASSLVEGTISYINYVDRLIELPLSLISVSLGAALLPVLSGLLARGEPKRFLQTTQHYLELNLLLTMAAAAGLYSLARPFVQLIFGHGHFNTPENITMTSQILQTYCWIMVFSSGVRVLTPAYYALKNTWFPAVISAVSLGAHLIIAPILLERLQVHGLMISTIISAALNLFFLILFFSKFSPGGLNLLQFFKNISIYFLLSVLTGGTAQLFYLLKSIFDFGFWGLLINIMISVGSALVVFVGAGRLLKVTAIEEVIHKVLQKIKSKPV
jgi:putative peptidoglycan lipid II flippase